MARTYFKNAYETQLTSPLYPSGLILNVSSTTDGPVTPFYAVLGPANNSNREYVLVTSKTATTYEISSLVYRYLDDSSAASGLTHETGTVLRISPLKQHFDDIWDELAISVNTQSHAASHQAGGGDDLSPTFLASTNGVLNSYREKVVSVATVGASTALDLNTAMNFIVTVNHDTNISFSNWGVAGFAKTVVVRFVMGSVSKTVTYSSVKFPGGTIPQISNTPNTTSILVIRSDNSGTTITGSLAGANYS